MLQLCFLIHSKTLKDASSVLSPTKILSHVIVSSCSMTTSSKTQEYDEECQTVTEKLPKLCDRNKSQECPCPAVVYIYSTTISDANKGCYEYLCPLIVYDRSLLPVSLRSQLYFAPLCKASLRSCVFTAAFSTSTSSWDASTLCAPLFHKW